MFTGIIEGQGTIGAIRPAGQGKRLTIEAALSGSRETAIEALVRNPLVGDPCLAHRFVERLDLP